MENILTFTLMGIIATACMSCFLWVITAARLSDVDMIRAIGAFYTKDEKNALVPGAFVHFTSGICFSFAYLFLFNLFPQQEHSFIYVLYGGIIGFAHGLIFAILLVHMVADFHPVKRFQKASFAVGVYHFLAHIIFGLSLGILTGFFL